MGRDESGTLASLKAHVRELIDPKIAEYGGRTVKSMGDGLLLEFPSVVDAVRCAVDVQRGMLERNAEVPAEQQIRFRIGINVGDIIIDGDDIFGDGVNVAARLEALAEPGGICVSRAVRDQVLDKLSFTFDELGAQQVKNIARPVDVYRIDLAGGPWVRPSNQGLTRRLSGRPLARLFVAGAGIAFLAVGVWWLARTNSPPPTLSPRGYSLAVLPFSGRTSEPSEAQLGEALSTELTSSLARSMPFASVVSSSVAGAYKDKSIDSRAAGRELGVRYLVEGTVRASTERTDVKAWVTAAGTGTEVWSETLQLNKTSDANGRQALITRLTSQVKAALIDAEGRRVLALPVLQLNADELTTRGDFIRDRDPEPSLKVLSEAQSLYEKALRLNPTLSTALMSEANVLAEMLDRDLRPDRDVMLREYDQMSLRLVAAADREARAWNIRADSLQRQGRWEAALEANATAQKLDPTRFGTMGQYADILIGMGKPQEALAAVDRAFSLQPPAGGVGWFWLCRCRAKLALGRYDEAIDACEKSASTGDYSWGSLSPHLFLVAAYALQGNDGRAQAEKAKLLAQRPNASIASFKARPISDVPAYLEQTEAHLYAGLRKAGIPEQ
jgi:TolB-like protein/tetratricopeptide (TPR) repeat protein